MTDTTRAARSPAGGARDTTLWSRGMFATLVAQFLSALADNALLFAAIALVRKENYPGWSGPLLQEFFVGTYILLAPFVGRFSDSMPKGRVMLYANLVKFAGSFAMTAHLDPFLSYALVGTGAAAYSPAKYGILGELTTQEYLVKANGLIEGSTLAAIVLGAIIGGALTDWSIEGALAAVSICYAASAASALLIPRAGHRAAERKFSFGGSIRIFLVNTRRLLKNRDARLSLIGTGLFWGAGASLRFLVIAWVPVALGVTNNRLPAFLTAMVAVGIVAGAALASKFVRLKAVNRARCRPAS